MIYEMVKDMRELQLKDHDILKRHQAMSEANKGQLKSLSRRQDLLEKRAFVVNWKQVGVIVGIIGTGISVLLTALKLGFL